MEISSGNLSGTFQWKISVEISSGNLSGTFQWKSQWKFLVEISVELSSGNYAKWHEQKVKIYNLVTLNASFLIRSEKFLA